MYGPSARMRAEREETRRSNVGVIITTVLSLLVVAAAVAVVAYLVLREPSSAVDSAERLDPVGTALPAPTSPPELPTAVPTPEAAVEPEPTALGFSGEQPAVAGLPTVAAPAEEAAGPTPTPRLIAQPTEPPPTPLPPAPTLPPAVPVTAVPVVALQPVEAAPPPAPTSAPAPARAASQPTPGAADDPFNIFDDENESRIVPAVDDPLQRVRDMQDEQRGNNQDEDANDSDRERRDDPVIVPAVAAPEVVVPRAVNGNGDNRDEPNVAGAPDVDAMIDEITARATDPNRNPNVNRPGRSAIVPSNGKKDDKDNGRATPSKSRKNPRDRADDKDKDDDKDGPGSTRQVRPNVPSIQPNLPNNGDNDPGVCTDPTAPGFPFDC